jgi:hypothetical protein
MHIYLSINIYPIYPHMKEGKKEKGRKEGREGGRRAGTVHY